MKNTAEATGDKPIAVRLQSASDVSVVNPLIAFYHIHGRKGEVLFFPANVTGEIPEYVLGVISKL
jgi:hypothetical protein